MKIEIPEEDRKELDARMDKEWKQKHGKGSYYKTFGDTTPGMVHGPVKDLGLTKVKGSVSGKTYWE